MAPTLAPAATVSGGIPAIVSAFRHAVGETGLLPRGPPAPRAEPDARVRLPGLRLARPGPATAASRSSARTAPRPSPRRRPRRRVDPEFFAAGLVAELSRQTDYWLGKQGRLTDPMVLRPGATHYEPISWDDAFALIGRGAERARLARRGGLLHLGPDQQRGGVPLPALRAGVRHQQPARLLATCATSRAASALERDDRHRQGDGHPRGLRAGRADLRHRPEPGHQPPADALRAAGGEAQRGARIVSVNPLPEAGLMRFKHPQTCRWTCSGRAPPLADALPAGPDQRRRGAASRGS